MMIAKTLKYILQNIFARFILIVHSFIGVWRLSDIKQNQWYWYFLFINILLLAETLYTIYTRRGNSYKWVCPCFFFYLLSTVPSIWILELDRLSRYDEVYKNTNLSATQESLSSVQGVTIPIKLGADVWVSVIEQSLLFLLILCRWILPRGEITRDQLSQLLFVYIGMASDIMELFVLFDEEKVRRDKGLVYVILVVWTISLLQFCLVLTATKNPKKARVAIRPVTGAVNVKKKKKDYLIMCLTTEVWSLMVTFLMQDGPFLCVRLFTLLNHNLITYNILFFTCKNLLVVMLLTYRLIVLCGRSNDPEEKSEDDDDDDDDETIVATSENSFITTKRNGKLPNGLLNGKPNGQILKDKSNESFTSKNRLSNGNVISVLNYNENDPEDKIPDKADDMSYI